MKKFNDSCKSLSSSNYPNEIVKFILVFESASSKEPTNDNSPLKMLKNVLNDNSV